MHPLWFYKHQHDNRIRSKLFVACQRWWFQWRFAAILVNCAPSRQMHNYCTPNIIKENFENFLIHRCNYILLSQVYCVWQVVKTPTTILNNPVLRSWLIDITSSVYLPAKPSVYHTASRIKRKPPQGIPCWRNDQNKHGLTLRRLMSYIYIYICIYIYGAPILDVSRSHTTTQHSR